MSYAAEYCDEKNAQRVIRLHAFDETHATALMMSVLIMDEDIDARFEALSTRESNGVRFADGSVATLNGERWEHVE